MNKKLIAKITAAACALSLFSFPASVPGLTKADVVKADDGTSVGNATISTEKSIDVTGTSTVNTKVENHPIKVTLPVKFNYVLNANENVLNVIAPVATIKNESGYAITVGAEVTVDPTNEKMKIVTSAPKKASADKQLFMYLKMLPGEKTNESFDETYAKGTNVIVFKTEGSKGYGAATSKPLITLANNDTGSFRIAGSLGEIDQEKAKKANKPLAYDDGDTVTAAIKFNFAAVK